MMPSFAGRNCCTKRFHASMASEIKNRVAPKITHVRRAALQSARNSVAHAEKTINVIATPYKTTGTTNDVLFLARRLERTRDTTAPTINAHGTNKRNEVGGGRVGFKPTI